MPVPMDDHEITFTYDRNNYVGVTSISVFTSINSSARATWRELEDYGVLTPYQTLSWYETWIRTVGKSCAETPLIITARDKDERPVLLLPLVLRSWLGIRFASFAGGKHANSNMPVLRSGVVLSSEIVERILSAVAQVHLPLDLFVLNALVPKWNSVSNPLVSKHARPHTATLPMLCLESDPHRLFANHLSADRKRKIRASDRRLNRSGISMHRAADREEINLALHAFICHKVRWFKLHGLKNPFQSSAVFDFFKDLAMEKTSGVEIYYLQGPHLEIVAVAAIVAIQKSVSLMFISYDASSPAASHSPGNKLIRELIGAFCERNFHTFDFGLGEATYKSSLGAKLVKTHSSIVPLTNRGRLAGVFISLWRALKIILKHHPHTLGLILRIKARVQQMVNG